jgi:3-isopropylmalate/(R)-2-methylmalate dehydratase small subunit
MQDPKRNVIKGNAVAVGGNDIDTDRIIPARFLRCVTFDGLGEHAFEDDRKQLAQAGKRHPLDEPSRLRARILVVGNNFGCGSSREHAPQALMRWGQGIEAIVGEGFSEIFFGNCVMLGIPCVTANADGVKRLMSAVDADPSLEVTLDLTSQQVYFAGTSIPANMPSGPRQQLMSGRWDTTAELLEAAPSIRAAAATLPYFSGWT